MINERDGCWYGRTTVLLTNKVPFYIYIHVLINVRIIPIYFLVIGNAVIQFFQLRVSKFEWPDGKWARPLTDDHLFVKAFSMSISVKIWVRNI